MTFGGCETHFNDERKIYVLSNADQKLDEHLLF